MNIMLNVLLALAVVYDLRERRIPNFLNACGLALALSMAAYRGGWEGLSDSLAAALVGLLVFFPFFAVRMIGAGDVKLFAVVGGFVGLGALLPVWFYTVLAGGLLGIVSVLLSRSFPQFISNMRMLLFSLLYHAPGPEISLADIAARTSARIPYALAIAAGALTWMWRS
ncbi:MAG: prepilin peptidase [Bacteroidota bacterium]